MAQKTTMGAKTRVIGCSKFPVMYTVIAVTRPATASGSSLIPRDPREEQVAALGRSEMAGCVRVTRRLVIVNILYIIYILYYIILYYIIYIY